MFERGDEAQRIRDSAALVELTHGGAFLNPTRRLARSASDVRQQLSPSGIRLPLLIDASLRTGIRSLQIH